MPPPVISCAMPAFSDLNSLSNWPGRRTHHGRPRFRHVWTVATGTGSNGTCCRPIAKASTGRIAMATRRCPSSSRAASSHSTCWLAMGRRGGRPRSMPMPSCAPFRWRWTIFRRSAARSWNPRRISTGFGNCERSTVSPSTSASSNCGRPRSAGQGGALSGVLAGAQGPATRSGRAVEGLASGQLTGASSTAACQRFQCRGALRQPP